MRSQLWSKLSRMHFRGMEMTGVEWVAGVDGCPAGWFAVFSDFSRTNFYCDTFRDIGLILNHDLHPAVIAVDVPIGLRDDA
jgi:predicted RNase H-like nuclease